MLQVTLKQIEFFITVAEAGSFSKAADELQYSQSNVSSVILQLEELMELPLIDRSNKKKIELTEHGRAFYAKAKDIISNCYTLEQMSVNNNPDIVSIGAHTIPAQYMLADVISYYKKKKPSIRFILNEGSAAGVQSMLNQRKIDLGIVIRNSITAADDCIPIYEDKIVIGMPNLPRYRNIISRNQSVIDLLKNELMVWNVSLEPFILKYLASIGLSKSDLNIVAEINSEQLARTCVIEGVGISFLSRLSMKCALKSQELLLYEEDRPPTRTVTVITNHDEKLSESCNSFISFLRSGEFDFEKCAR